MGLKAAKLAIMTFAIEDKEVILVHICMDSMTVLSYVIKMCGTKNQELVAISKDFWQYLLTRKIAITTDNLQGSMNVEADRKSRQIRDSSECGLNSDIFRILYQIREHQRWISLL